MKTLQNNFTTPEQSKRLLELGVPADSADCCLRRILTDGGFCETWRVDVFNFTGKIHDDYLPCWSVGRLIEIYRLCVTTDQHEENPLETARDNIVSFIVGIIKRAISAGYFEFEELED